MIPFQHELAVLITSALPISELRGGIPLAMFTFGFSPFKTLSISILGNMLPIIPCYIFLDRFAKILMHRFYTVNRFLTWLFERTRRVHGDHFDYFSWAPFALFVFVAVPLPLTGAWSGVLAAIVFGIPFRRAIPAISLGVVASGVIILLLVSSLRIAF